MALGAVGKTRERLPMIPGPGTDTVEKQSTRLRETTCAIPALGCQFRLLSKQGDSGPDNVGCESKIVGHTAVTVRIIG